MFTVPFPEEAAVPINETASVTLSTGEKATISFTPEQSTTLVQIPMVAVSKHPDTSYEVLFDGTRGFGESNIPPTDPDDAHATWIPAKTFSKEMKVIIRYTGTPDRTFSVQVQGWEEV